MKNIDTRSQGRLYEKKAVDFLISQGYRMVARNYFYGRSEIDLVMLSPEQVLVFVEVKYRSPQGDTFNPWESVSPKQRQSLYRAAAGFLEEHPGYADHYSRYDAIIITPSATGDQIKHFPDAFREGG